jgi:PilZ domain
MIDERRRRKRFAMELPVNVLSGDTGSSYGVTKDISVEGIYFYVTKDVKELENIEFLVTFPPEITLVTPVRVKCMGKIIRAEPDVKRGTGIAASIERYEFVSAHDA